MRLLRIDRNRHSVKRLRFLIKLRNDYVVSLCSVRRT